MKTPAYVICAANQNDVHILSHNLGAAWETPKGNFRVQLHFYNTQPCALLYLQKPNMNRPSATLEHLLQHGINNYTETHRVFSAKKLKDGGAWFQNHGVIIKPVDTSLLVLRVQTLPHPNGEYALYFAPMAKAERIKNHMTEGAGFSDESSEPLDPDDFI